MSLESENQFAETPIEAPQFIEESLELKQERGRDIPDDPEKMEAYLTANTEIDERIQETVQTKESLSAQLETIRTRLDIGSQPLEPENFPSVTYLDERLAKLEKEKIKASANYPGNWTLLMKSRMEDPAIKEKFIETRTEALPELKSGEQGPFDKTTSYKEHYTDQIENYDENIAHVFNATEVGPAASFHKEPKNLGTGNIGKQGAVFMDAEVDGKPLTPRQKNIIEAHEKGHGLRDFRTSIDQLPFKESLDFDSLRAAEAAEQLKNPDRRFVNYIYKPEEIAERMAQLKNYFGFAGNEPFTREHLAYAREHYIEDTGLDNSMSIFFKAVTPETEEKFIETINRYPL
jgi:hypothetical protein